MLVSLNPENLYNSYVNNNYNISRQRKKGHYMYYIEDCYIGVLSDIFYCDFCKDIE